jgi:hypothetical protein
MTVLLASAVDPSKESGEAPVMFPEERVMLPFAVRVWVTVKAPLFVVVMPVFPKETEVAFVVPRLRAAAESTVKAPAEVDQVEAAPAVKVRAPAEVNEEAPVGVRLTEPAPEAVKFPEASVKAIGVDEAVVMVAPLLYACWSVTLVAVAQVGQVMFPAASSESGEETETATVPEASGRVQVRAAVRSAEVRVPVKEAVAVVV